MAHNHFASGEWNVICDVCNKKIKSGEAKQRWDGFIVCPDDFETRHPQDFVIAKQDKFTVPFSRPVPELIFTDVVYACTSEGKSAIASLAVAGCSITGTS